jgi:Flp pilus assembly protein TadG
MPGREATTLRRSRSRNDSGATAVEFALILLPLALLVFGIVQYGFYFLASQSASNAARDAVRRASVGDCPGPDDTQLQAYVKKRLGAVNQGGLAVTRSYKEPNGNTAAFDDLEVGDQVVVTVKFQTLDLNFPFLPVPNDSSGKAVVVKEADARIEDLTPGGACV